VAIISRINRICARVDVNPTAAKAFLKGSNLLDPSAQMRLALGCS
jgi:hypothetical protein